MTNGDALVTGANGKPSKGILLNDFSDGNDMVVVASLLGTGGDDRSIILQLGTNSFSIFSADVGSGAVDVDVTFTAQRIA